MAYPPYTPCIPPVLDTLAAGLRGAIGWLSVGFEMDFSKANAWDTQTTDKTVILEKVNESFEILKERVGMLTEEDLNREVEVFGMKMSTRNFIISMIAHAHEHLGQSIAYARINGVVPPWSGKEN